MANRRYRSESMQPWRGGGMAATPDNKTAGHQPKIFHDNKSANHGQHGKPGWNISEGNKGGSISDPKGGKQTTGEMRSGMSTSTKKPSTPKGGSKPNSGNHAKSQGWEL